MKIIPLNVGVEIVHACKRYTHKTGIPEEIHKAIYGNLIKGKDGGVDQKESDKLYKKKLEIHTNGPKKKPETVKDEPKD